MFRSNFIQHKHSFNNVCKAMKRVHLFSGIAVGVLVWHRLGCTVHYCMPQNDHRWGCGCMVFYKVQLILQRLQNKLYIQCTNNSR